MNKGRHYGGVKSGTIYDRMVEVATDKACFVAGILDVPRQSGIMKLEALFSACRRDLIKSA